MTRHRLPPQEGKTGLWRFISEVNHATKVKRRMVKSRITYQTKMSERLSVMLYVIGLLTDEEGYAQYARIQEVLGFKPTHLKVLVRRKLVTHVDKGRYKPSETGWWVWERMRDWFDYNGL